MKKKQHKNRLVLIMIIMLIALVGCGSTTNNITAIEEEHKSSAIGNIEQYKSELVAMIQTGETPENSNSIEDYMILKSSDVIENAEIVESYNTYNAIYLQINNEFMYRFQLNSNKKVESYIKYKLEA